MTEIEESGNETEEEANVEDLFMEDVNNEPVNGGFDFDEDFYR